MEVPAENNATQAPAHVTCNCNKSRSENNLCDRQREKKNGMGQILESANFHRTFCSSRCVFLSVINNFIIIFTSVLSLANAIFISFLACEYIYMYRKSANILKSRLLSLTSTTKTAKTMTRISMLDREM